MKIALKTKDQKSIPCVLPFEGCDYVRLCDRCPACKESHVKIQGGETTRGHDTYSAPAACLSCRQIVGTLVVTVSTLFGLKEDEAVLVNGRARVY